MQMSIFSNQNVFHDDWSFLHPEAEDIWNVQNLYPDDSIQAMILEMSVFFNSTHYVTSQTGVRG